MSDATAPVPAAAGSKGDITTIELARRERAVARRSAQIRATIPNVELSAVVDMHACLALEAQLSCGTTALLVRACALALTEVPRANGSYRDGRLELYSRINIGVTIAEDDLYLVPTILDADAKSAAEIALELTALARRAGEGKLTTPELSGATFTVTDSIVFEIATLTPLIIAPQCAALAAGPVREVPVVREGQVVAGHTMGLTLACDHRILYGARAAAFLHQIKAHLEAGTP
ncbi:MAG: 2-oxo acid dehydrogenase subunit E2 [Solirubrobacteraceae bacterium]